MSPAKPRGSAGEASLGPCGKKEGNQPEREKEGGEEGVWAIFEKENGPGRI